MSPIVLNKGLGRLWQEGEMGFSEEMVISQENQRVAIDHYYVPISRRNIVDEFQYLKADWMKDTRFLSSITDICMHPSYQRIIGMGQDALPLIFDELKKESNHWYWALTSITGQDPIPPQQRGVMGEMRESWLRWAKERDFI